LDNLVHYASLDALRRRCIKSQADVEYVGAAMQVADLHAGYIFITPQQTPQPVPVNLEKPGQRVVGVPASFVLPFLISFLELLRNDVAYLRLR
jgi:hypothetical protein